jgi:hypothetical protein
MVVAQPALVRTQMIEAVEQVVARWMKEHTVRGPDTAFWSSGAMPTSGVRHRDLRHAVGEPGADVDSTAFWRALRAPATKQSRALEDG